MILYPLLCHLLSGDWWHYAEAQPNLSDVGAAKGDDRVGALRVVQSLDQRTTCRDAACAKLAFGQIKDK